MNPLKSNVLTINIGCWGMRVEVSSGDGSTQYSHLLCGDKNTRTQDNFFKMQNIQGSEKHLL